LDRLPSTAQVVIVEKLVVLAINPAALANMIKRLQGFPGQYRLRVGNYRVTSPIAAKSSTSSR
jgi:mRNA-degrading endonuclease RelE of RelBE toxin-antitoxin system